MAVTNYDVTVETIEFSKLKELELIGQGGFGEVYSAKHSDWGPVAFKRLTVQFIGENDRAASELKREVANHTRLKHPNIIQLMGVVFERGNYGVILEFATYGDLWRFILKFYPVPWQWKLSMASGIALGMNYLHTAGDRPLIHADLKMKNVLVSDGFKPKISDFGLSRWKMFSYEMTRRDCTGGTVTHIPPENWRDINTLHTERYDSYSFGVLLWELLSENHPYDAVDANTIRTAVLNGERPHMYFVPAEVPDFLKDMIANCWAQTPQHRPLFSALKQQFEHYISQYRSDIRVAKQQLQQREHQAVPQRETAHRPVPNVPTGDFPMSVDDSGTMMSYSGAMADPGQIRQLDQPGVQLPAPGDISVRTNENLANIQPESSNLLFQDIPPDSRTSVDLHPSDPAGFDLSLSSDHSIRQEVENMELSSGEMRQDTLTDTNQQQ